ncbi:hypothetical protein [Novosphingobium sp. MMS21-SN21R]|uniref:hypothetical protein n=1 Tax=Novosphingobium sp. MMS21-SN21R TaxID=2969298 RepID=UPI0028842AE9|nr:hypothetical protein [Novosphingobium sp. MMS21-SN21R]MDT0507167.1 hypothetical protein [Novosphingobium sp. MMS21-SN21R]
MITQVEMLRLLLGEANLDFARLKTIGNAVSAETRTEAMALEVERLALTNGWIQTRLTGTTVSIEPATPEIQILFTDSVLYHVSYKEHRDFIADVGLKPGTGGNTSLKRSYPPRLHLVAFLRDAFQFIHHQLKPSSAHVRGARLFDTLDIYEVRVKCGFEYYNDDHFDGRGLWITSGVPHSDLTLVDPKAWHDLYQSTFPDDFPQQL